MPKPSVHEERPRLKACSRMSYAEKGPESTKFVLRSLACKCTCKTLAAAECIAVASRSCSDVRVLASAAHMCVCMCFCLFVCPFVLIFCLFRFGLFVCLLVRLFVCSFVRLFVCLCSLVFLRACSRGQQPCLVCHSLQRAEPAFCCRVHSQQEVHSKSVVVSL